MPGADIMDPPQELFPLQEPASAQVAGGESGQEGGDKEEWQQQPQQPPVYMAIVARRARSSQSSTPSTPSSPEGLHQRMSSNSVRQANFLALPDSGQYHAQAVELLEQVAFERRRTLGDDARPANDDADTAAMLFAEVHHARRARTHSPEAPPPLRSSMLSSAPSHTSCAPAALPPASGLASRPVCMAPHPALVPQPLNLHPYPSLSPSRCTPTPCPTPSRCARPAPPSAAAAGV